MHTQRALSLALVSLLLGVAGCVDHPMQNRGPTCGCVIPIQSYPQSSDRAVDILFVIDNAGSMAGENQPWRANLAALTSVLRKNAGGLPDLHVGVTSTDLGAGPFQITYCEDEGGDAGRLLTGACTSLSGANYIVDVEPQDCQITRSEDGDACTSHSCEQIHCVAEPSTILVEDADTGCPRCRNFQDEPLTETLTCIADLGTLGCGFEQPLEAMYKALDANPANAGFLRENAYLAVVFITNEDDCSASNPLMFDNSPPGCFGRPLTAFRCFEFGITCDINSYMHQGTRHNCVPREDGAALLHPVSRYIELLHGLKDPQMLVLAAIAGPVTPSANGMGYDVVVGLDDLSRPIVEPTCTTVVRGAVPGIRLHTLVDFFNDESDQSDWAYTSICSADYSPALRGIGMKIVNLLDDQCLRAPLKGCSDPGVEFGSPQADVTCDTNSQCLADCQVLDVFERGLPSEQESIVPPCLEVAPDGSFLSGNTDRNAAYAGGHPDDRDPNLPVEACWHIGYQPDCPHSNFAALRIARQSDPPPRSFAEVSCRQIPRDEQLCNDQVDNDEDCLIDMDDPCCANAASCDLDGVS